MIYYSLLNRYIYNGKSVRFLAFNDNFNKFWFDKSKDLLIENYYFDKLISVENCEINYKILTDEELLENYSTRSNK